MICPKCGRPVEENAVICRGCDFILDTAFLGGDILDEEHQLRPGQGGVDPAVFNLADAVILGNIGDDSSSFETSDSGFHLKKDLQAARLYVSGRSQAVMSPDAVIGRIDSSEQVRLTPFEKHVLRFIDGRRPVETIRRQAGLDEAEVKTALANLADKGVVKVVGRALADAADFDVDTAPGAANKKAPPRRMRGTLVGAVVVVGDAADQAIDDAFRTQVRAEAPRLDDPDDDDDGDGVFSSSGEGMPTAGSVDFDKVDSFDDRAAADVPPVRASSSSKQARPSAQKGATNNPRDAKRTTGPRVGVADVDASDGFDDFGDPSNLATAVVDVPSISDDSLPAARPEVDVALRASISNLSELEDFDAPVLGDLADSRVEPRPMLPAPSPSAGRLARSAPPALPSLSGPSASQLGVSLDDEERAAMSGGVWGSGPPAPAQPPTPGLPETNVAAREELSTSLSDLLDSDEAPAKKPAVRVDSAEPTAFRAPPAPMVQVVPPRRAELRPGPVADPPSTSFPVEDWPDSTPRARPAVAAALRADADDLFPNEGSFDVETEGHEAPAASDDDDDVSTHELFAAEAVASPPAMPVRKSGPPPAPSGPRPPPPPALKPNTNVRLGGAGGSAPPPPAVATAAAPRPAVSADLTAPPSADDDDAADATNDLPLSHGSSAESLESAMVIRPAAKALPLGMAAKRKALANVPPPIAPIDDDDFMVDPDATMNLPALPKSQEGARRRRAPSEVSASAAVAAPSASEGPAKPRRPPTEDMRRKARNLFEQAQKDHAIGRIGAARMNAKLATIYDPDNDEFRRILDVWEEKPTASTTAALSRPEYVVLYEQAQDLEDEGDVDGALELLQKGITMAPNAAAFHNRIGVILAMRKREFERAAAEIEKAISLEPDNPHYRNNLGKVMQKGNKRKDAAANAR